MFITSDHGHVEATGFGQPSEGLLAQTRGKRARIYMDRLAALRVQNVFADTILWDNDGILPDQMATFRHWAGIILSPTYTGFIPGA